MRELIPWALAFSVSLDALAVSLAGAAADKRKPRRNAFRAGLLFGGFQFLMPVAGFFAADFLLGWVGTVDHWIALALLVFIGGRMIADGIRGEAIQAGPEFFCWHKLLVLAVATSIDALAVGASLPALGENVWKTSVLMGIVTAAVSAFAVLGGGKILHFSPAKASLIGGAVLILIGLRIVWTG